MNNVMTKVRTITIFMTDRCNLRCKYCFEQYGGYKNSDFKEESIEKLVELLKERDPNEGILTLQLFGGEPTLRLTQIELLFRKIKEAQLKYDIGVEFISNGYNINFDILDKIYNLSDGISYISFGISMILNEKYHDEDRVNIKGEGTYQDIYQNLIKLINKYPNMNKSVHSVISKKNIYHIDEIIEQSFQFYLNNDIEKVTFALVSVSSLENNEDEYTIDELDLYYKAYFNFIKRHEKYLKSLCVEKQDEILDMFFFPISYKTYLGMDYDYGKMGFCQLYKSEITLTSDGYILACHRQTTYENKNKFKNIMDCKSYEEFKTWNEVPSEIIEIYADGSEYGFYKPMNEEGFDCTNCHFTLKCGTCPAANYANLKTFNMKSMKECRRTMSIVELNLKYEELKLKKEQNELLKAINEKIDTLGNLNINIADAIQMLLTTNADNK